MSVSLQEQHKLRLCLCLLRIWRQNSWSLGGDLIPGLQGDASFQRKEFQQQQQQCTRDEGVVVCVWMLPLPYCSHLSHPLLILTFLSMTLIGIRLGHVILIICFYWELEDEHVYGLQVCATSTPLNIDEGHWGHSTICLIFAHIFYDLQASSITSPQL